MWRKCITTKVPDMPKGWLDRAGVAIIGETGKHVSNNHDVMSLEVREGGNSTSRVIWPPPMPDRPCRVCSSGSSKRAQFFRRFCCFCCLCCCCCCDRLHHTSYMADE